MSATVSIIHRDTWGAKSPNGRLSPMSDLKGVIVHHSAGAVGATGSREVRGIQTFHQDARGWVDVGYNYLISSVGSIYEGRGFYDKNRLAMGAHCKGSNRNWVGICVLGRFTESEKPTKYQIVSLVNLIQYLAVRHWIMPIKITAHSDHRNTECPGTLSQELPLIRQLVGSQILGVSIEVS